MFCLFDCVFALFSLFYFIVLMFLFYLFYLITLVSSGLQIDRPGPRNDGRHSELNQFLPFWTSMQGGDELGEPSYAYCIPGLSNLNPSRAVHLSARSLDGPQGVKLRELNRCFEEY